MATIRSGATTDEWTIDSTSKAGRVTLYDSTGTAIPTGTSANPSFVTATQATRATYAAAATFTPPATPTDMVTIYGSASRTVRVIALRITTTNTAAGSQEFRVIKRSAVNTTGTFVAATAVPLDSTNAAATATVGHYTVNPGGLGAAVGTIIIDRIASPVNLPATFAGIVRDAGHEILAHFGLHNAQTVILRGTAQGLALNFNGAALVAGQIHTFSIVWTEE